jgi:hypothetical protein
MSWVLVIITAGFTQMGAYTVDRAFRTLDGGPWPDRAQCEEALAQQRLQYDETLACVWRPPQERPLNKDRADLRMKGE